MFARLSIGTAALLLALGGAAVPASADRGDTAGVSAAGAGEVRGGAVQGGTVRGGDPYRTAAGGRCLVGFTVVGGFLTAGRCGRAGDLVYAADGQVMGSFQASSYPGNDYAWVRLNAGWTPVGQVRGGATGAVSVRGSTEAPVGAAVCRYGSTTGWRCGTLQARNQTVVFAGGTVSGLTRTNVCAEPGDAGAPFLAGDQAQGLLSGGSGNCGSGGTSYFQPVREPLAAYGLTLLTAA